MSDPTFARPNPDPITADVARRAAIHEASHAVVALRQGVEVEFVTVDPAQSLNGRGRCRLGPLRPQGRSNPDVVLPRCRVRLAGYVGEWFLGSAEHFANEDLVSAERLLEGLGWSAELREETLARLKAETFALVAGCWREIEEVAASLAVLPVIGAAGLEMIANSVRP